MPIATFIEAKDIIEVIAIIVTFIIAVAGWKKNSAEREKFEAETASLYANLAADAVKREKNTRADMDELERKIELQEKHIAELKEIIQQKDKRIEELETLTVAQEKKLKQLQTELNGIRKSM